jgi:hypothetical protein
MSSSEASSKSSTHPSTCYYLADHIVYLRGITKDDRAILALVLNQAATMAPTATPIPTTHFAAGTPVSRAKAVLTSALPLLGAILEAALPAVGVVVVASVVLAVPVGTLAVPVVLAVPSITFNVALIMLYMSQLPESPGEAGTVK